MGDDGPTFGREQLDTGAEYYVPSDNADSAVLRLDAWWMDEHVRGPRVLELGCSDGLSTELLLPHAEVLDVVEGSERYCGLVRDRVRDPRVTVHCSLFEEFEPAASYDDIVFTRSLDYVQHPIELLERIRGWLAPSGRLHIVVQNARSLHRRLGVALGAMPTVDHLTEHSLTMGHRRVYTPELIREQVEAAGYEVALLEGFLLKPFGYGALERCSDDLVGTLIPALFEVGKDVPTDLCCQLYVLAR